MAAAAPTPATPTYYTIIWDNGSNYPNNTPNYMIMATSAAGAAAEVTTKEAAGDQASVFGGPYSSIAAAQAAIPGGTPASDITAPVGSIPGVTTPAPKTPAATPSTPAKPPVATIHQPLFDQRMRTVQNPMNGGLAQFERGFMVWDTSLTASAGYSATDPPAVSFLFNPSTVQASYSLSDSTAQAAMIFGVAGGGVPYVGLQQQMNFTIMFDRTYEVNGTTATQEADLQAMGCEVDVRQMKQFTGMFSNSAGTSGFYTSGANATNPTAGATALGTGQTITQATGTGVGPQQGIMLMMPSYCYFGTSLFGGCSQFYGYVDSWDVQYTHYTADMVPIRCVVDIEYTLLPQSSNNLAELANTAVKSLENSQNLAAASNVPGPIGFL
jgi:hypothetical protein